MENLITSLKPIFTKLWKKYKIEFVLIMISLIITIISISIYVRNQTKEDNDIEIKKEISEEKIIPVKIYVDLAGAVIKPDVYQLPSGARLKDVLKLGGGLSADADRGFFSRNYNLSRLVVDQEKIYIPTTYDINAGLFTENTHLLDYNQPQSIQPTISKIDQSDTLNEILNINLAGLEELDQLPGVGKVTAEKIIRGRPYSLIDELLTKKIVNKSVFDKIKDLIAVY